MASIAPSIRVLIPRGLSQQALLRAVCGRTSTGGFVLMLTARVPSSLPSSYPRVFSTQQASAMSQGASSLLGFKIKVSFSWRTPSKASQRTPEDTMAPSKRLVTSCVSFRPGIALVRQHAWLPKRPQAQNTGLCLEEESELLIKQRHGR